LKSPIRIKTFRCKTLQDAFQQIRTEFGPDASILETKAARYGLFGRSRIEVTASSKNCEPLSTAPAPSDTEVSESESETTRDKSQSVCEAQNVPSALDASEEEFCADQATILDQSNSSPVGTDESIEPKTTDGVFRQVHQELLEAGIDPGIAGQWIEAALQTSNTTAMQDVWTLRSELLSWIRDLVHAAPPICLDESRQQVFAFIGPCGSGKTTSLAKIAANLSIEHGIAVGVLSADTLRLGSNFLLQNYAEVLGWRFEVADSIEQVATCMRALAGCRVVLIDTNGCSPVDTDSMERLSQLLEISQPTETHLVLSSTINTRSFLRCEHAFERLKPNRMILTRLDESGGLGSLFPCLQVSDLPISYLTNGQKIPADLVQATEARLAQQVMALAE
jgi:flagellar biosynthesis protein FlhF